MASDTPIIAPKWLIVPEADRVSGCNYEGSSNATTGALLMSGAMLFFFNGTQWEMTSGATGLIA